MRTGILSYILGLVLLANASAAEGQTAAVLIGMTGRCEVAAVGAGAFSPATAGMGLHAGDILSVRDGTATVLRSDGRVETIEAGKRVQVEAAGRRDTSRGALGRLWETLVNRASMAASGTRIYSDAGAVRALKAQHIDLVSPRNTALLAAPTRIAWEVRPDVKTYHVRVHDGNGSVVWSSTTTRAFAAIDAGSVAFEPGEWYFVRVGDVRRGGPASEEAYFRVLRPREQELAREDAEAVKRSVGAAAGKQAEALAVGGIYEHWDLLEDALATYHAAGEPPGPALAQAIEFAHVKNGRRWSDKQ
ncbi:MAG: hypothetical protein HY303_07975 [Candidatus Wallbacteria bacterium]|nr:hypothetical protein [Candidatus Wallbacteria bacterium]